MAGSALLLCRTCASGLRGGISRLSARRLSRYVLFRITACCEEGGRLTSLQAMCDIALDRAKKLQA
jgi:hypothetical protein